MRKSRETGKRYVYSKTIQYVSEKKKAKYLEKVAFQRKRFPLIFRLAVKTVLSSLKSGHVYDLTVFTVMKTLFLMFPTRVKR